MWCTIVIRCYQFVWFSKKRNSWHFSNWKFYKDQIRKYKTRKKELDRDSVSTFVYVRSDLMSKIIKSSIGEKGKGKKKKKGSFLE